MGSLAQNAAKGTILASKGFSGGLIWFVVSVAVLKATTISAVIIGPWAILIPVIYLAITGDMALNKIRGALEKVADEGLDAGVPG